MISVLVRAASWKSSAARWDEVLVSISHEMLSLARTRLDGAGLRECQVRHGDMYKLPVDDADFDIATLHLVLHYADDPVTVIQEAGRVMAPGGRLVIVDFAPHEMEGLRDSQLRIAVSAFPILKFRICWPLPTWNCPVSNHFPERR